MKTDRSTKPFIVMFAGLIACGVHFTLMYAIATLACLRSQSVAPAFDIRLASIAMTAIVLGALAAYLVRRIRTSAPISALADNESRQFLSCVTVALGLLAVVAVLWVTLPALIIADCRT